MLSYSFRPYSKPRIQFLFFIFIVFALQPVTSLRAAIIDRVVAEVNDDVITLSELNKEGEVYLKKIAGEVAESQRDEAINKALDDILNGLIDKALVAQEAAKRNLTVSDVEVDEAISRISAANNVSMDQLYSELKENGLDFATYKDNLKSQLLQNKLITREVRSKIVITEDMILDHYDTEYTQHVDEGGYYLLQIGISWGDNEESKKSVATLYEDKLTAKKTATRIHALAVNGEDFHELARKFSDLPSAADGGDIGVFEEDEMASYMKTAVTSLKPGEISAIVETPVGFQFFKLLSNKEGGIVMQAPYDSVKEEIREKLFTETMKEEFKIWIRELKEKSYIKKLL